MSYATRHPEHPAKLVLSSTAAVTRQDRTLEMFEKLVAPKRAKRRADFFENPGPEQMADYQKKCLPLYNRTPSPPENMQRAVMNPKLMADFFLHEERVFNFLPDLGKIKCPTLITAGDLDPITPLADSKDIAAAMTPGVARLEVFENAGHGCIAISRIAFSKMLDEFILA